MICSICHTKGKAIEVDLDSLRCPVCGHEYSRSDVQKSLELANAVDTWGANNYQKIIAARPQKKAHCVVYLDNLLIAAIAAAGAIDGYRDVPPVVAGELLSDLKNLIATRIESCPKAVERN